MSDEELKATANGEAMSDIPQAEEEKSFDEIWEEMDNAEAAGSDNANLDDVKAEKDDKSEDNKAISDPEGETAADAVDAKTDDTAKTPPADGEKSEDNPILEGTVPLKPGNPEWLDALPKEAKEEFLTMRSQLYQLNNKIKSDNGRVQQAREAAQKQQEEEIKRLTELAQKDFDVFAKEAPEFASVMQSTVQAAVAPFAHKIQLLEHQLHSQQSNDAQKVQREIDREKAIIYADHADADTIMETYAGDLRDFVRLYSTDENRFAQILSDNSERYTNGKDVSYLFNEFKKFKGIATPQPQPDPNPAPAATETLDPPKPNPAQIRREAQNQALSSPSSNDNLILDPDIPKDGDWDELWEMMDKRDAEEKRLRA